MNWWKILGILFLLVIIFLAIYFYRKDSIPKAAEGFQIASYGPPAYWTTTYRRNATGTSYTIFDPEALYVQGTMLNLALGASYRKMKRTELSMLNKLLYMADVCSGGTCSKAITAGMYNIIYSSDGCGTSHYRGSRVTTNLWTSTDPNDPSAWSAVKYMRIMSYYHNKLVTLGYMPNRPMLAEAYNDCIIWNIWASDDVRALTIWDHNNNLYTGTPYVVCGVNKGDYYYLNWTPWWCNNGEYANLLLNTPSDKRYKLCGFPTHADGVMGYYSSADLSAENTIITQYISNLVNNFDVLVINAKFNNHPVGWTLSGANSRINPFASMPTDMPVACSGLGITQTDINDMANGAKLYDDNSNYFVANNLNNQNPLLNTSSWALVDVMPATGVNGSATISYGRNIANLYRNDFLTKKGITYANQTGILNKTIAVNGTMDDINMGEIVTSVFYMMHFNFSERSFSSRQLRYSAVAPFGLYMSTEFKFEDEVYIKPDGSLAINNAACTYNTPNSTAINNTMLLSLTYDARNYIANWATNRRLAINRYYAELAGIIGAAVSSPSDATRAAATAAWGGAAPSGGWSAVASTINSNISTINTDISTNTYLPSPTINLFSATSMSTNAYVQTSENVQFTLDQGLSRVTNNATLSFKTTFISYFTFATMVGTPMIVSYLPPATCPSINSPSAGTIPSCLVHSFQGKFVSYNTTTKLLTIDTSAYSGIIQNPGNIFTNTSPTFNPYVVEFIPPASTTASTGMTAVIKGNILNSLAQCYYNNQPAGYSTSASTTDSSTSDAKITTIVDVYQVGNTIFDVRFRKSERDPTATATILGQISTLNATYNTYRKLQLSDSERNNLEANYNLQLQTLNANLQLAVNAFSNPTCGKKAQYITIKLSTPGTPISLSQIEVISNTAQNIAPGSDITIGKERARRSKIYGYEDCSGTILGAYDSTIYKTIDNWTEKNVKYAHVLNQAIVRSHLNYLVDGITEPRYEPQIFESPRDANGNLYAGDCINIDLGSEAQIAYVRLTFPKNTTGTLPQYSVTLNGVGYETIAGGSKTTATIGTFTSAAVFADPADTSCPTPSTTLYNPYSIARFYAKIVSTPTTGYVDAGNGSFIQFTGYSEDKAGDSQPHSFNPKYNGGFQYDLRSASGNTNYQPTIKYNKNNTDAPPLSCSDPTQIEKMMRDYMLNIPNANFQNRNPNMYDQSGTYNYYVSQVTGYADGTTTIPNSKACNFSWKELKVNAVTNKTEEEKPRWGTLVYRRNVYDWKVTNDYYDASECTISNTGSALNPILITISKPGISEVTLNNLNGVCGSKTCSDLDVIDGIIKSYNRAQTNRIVRVTKAITPAPNTCEFECYTKNNTATATRIRMDIAVENTSQGCVYSYKNFKVVTEDRDGTYIQSNTPLLTQIYSYANEMMRQYQDNFNSIYSNLSTMVQPHVTTGGSGVMGSVETYRMDSWKAFGQIKGLTTTCATSCADPLIIRNFLKNRRNFTTRINAIKGVGTSSPNQCDFLVDEMPIVLSGTAAAVSKIYRATIDTGATCATTAVTDITTANTGISKLIINMASTNKISNLPGVIQSNHVTFGDTITFSITAGTPAWMINGTNVSIKSTTSYIEGNISATTTNSVTMNKLVNASGPFNLAVNVVAGFNGTTMYAVLTSVASIPTWLVATATIQIRSDPTNTMMYNGTISSIGANIIKVVSGANSVTNLTAVFNGSRITITGAIPSWLIAGASIQIYDAADNTIYNGPVSSVSGQDVILLVPPAVPVTMVLPTAPTTPSSVSLTASFSGQNMTITGTIPTWLQGGVLLKIKNSGNVVIYNNYVSSVTGTTIALAVQPTTSTAGTYTFILSTFNIILSDTYKISDLTPNKLSSAGTWGTPMTIGSGTYNATGPSMSVAAASNAYIVGEPLLMSNAASSFTATIASYSGTTLGLSNVSSGAQAGQTYTIQQTAQPVVFPTIPVMSSPIDWIDCTSNYAKAATGQASLTQSGVNTCTSGATTYTFASATDTNVDTLQLASNPVPSGIVDDGTCTNFSAPATLSITGYSGSIVGTPVLISGKQYEYRITTLDTLPFNDTYKDITFYGQGGCKISDIRGATIATSPNANFRLVGAPSSANITAYTTLFINWWNTTYYYASAAQNKKAIGTISRYWYDSSNDAIVFECTSAEFGPMGPSDIRVYNENATYAYYSVVYRRRYVAPPGSATATAPTLTPVSTITSPANTSVDFIVYSAKPVAAPATLTSLSAAINSPSTSAYIGMPNADTLAYTIQSPTTMLQGTNKFRFLRFSVRGIGAGTYAEITRLYFYTAIDPALQTEINLQNAFNARTSATMTGQFNGEYLFTITSGVGWQPSWLTRSTATNAYPSIKIITNDVNKIILFSGVPANISGNTITFRDKITGVPTTSASYFIMQGTTGQGINLQKATFRMHDISSNYFNYQNTDCSGGYLQVPNPYKTSYNICAVNDRIDTATQNKYEYTATPSTTPGAGNAACAIGYVKYEESYQNMLNIDTGKCITIGTYGGVNDLLPVTNKDTPRLRFYKDQKLIINLGDLLQIDAYTFVTGRADRLPSTFLLEGSINGLTWATLNDQTSLPTTGNTKGNNFFVPGYFPTNRGATIPLSILPDFYRNQPAGLNLEGFQGVAAVATPPPFLKPAEKAEPYFKSDETALEPRYALPLGRTAQPIATTNSLYQPLNTQARRIKTMRFRILETHDPASKFAHMSVFQFHTPLGPIPSSMVRVSNPMGSRRNAADAPEALLESTAAKRWVDYNKLPAIFSFVDHPQTQITGFQFALPDAPNALAALPSRWRFEGSYDGRTWEIYHEQEEKAHFLGVASPVYKFKSAI